MATAQQILTSTLLIGDEITECKSPQELCDKVCNTLFDTASPVSIGLFINDGEFTGYRSRSGKSGKEMFTMYGNKRQNLKKHWPKPNVIVLKHETPRTKIPMCLVLETDQNLPPASNEATDIGLFCESVFKMIENGLEALASEHLMIEATKRVEIIRNAIMHSEKGIAITDATGKIVEHNWAFARLLNKRSHLLTDAKLSDLEKGEKWSEIERSLTAAGKWEGQLDDVKWNVEHHVANIYTVKQDNQENTYYIITVSDMSAAIEAQAKIDYLSSYDAKTQIFSREGMLGKAEKMTQAATEESQFIACVYLDINRFKACNEAYGETFGDGVLIEFAKRLKAHTRNEDIIARVGVDHFAVLLNNVGDDDILKPKMEAMFEALTKPYEIGGHTTTLSVSSGVSIYPTHSDSVSELLMMSSIAMQRAKVFGSNKFMLFSTKNQKEYQGQKQLESEMQYAVERGEFAMYLQPLVSMETRETIGYEALLRWRHKERGIVPPDLVIPYAEKSGLICGIGEWLVVEACRTLSAMKAVGSKCTIAINVSPVQLRDDNFLIALEKAVQVFGIEKGRLEIEITESTILHDAADTAKKLTRISEMGIRIAIDDFGTGFSSLARLKEFPVDKLKIDKLFVQELPHSQDDCAIVTATIAMAKALGMRIVAEGIETEEQAKFIKDTGGDIGQGYLFGKPSPWQSHMPAGSVV